MQHETRSASFVIDSCVLIDYKNSNPVILSLFARHFGALYAPIQVLHEAHSIDISFLERFSINIYDVEIKATDDPRYVLYGNLSIADQACFLAARDNNWTCITNDGSLRRACEEGNVQHCGGLGLMLQLNKAGQLPRERAMCTANQIRESNPWMSLSIILKFYEQLT